MSKLIDLTGQKFGRLTALKYIGNRKWLCKCECGKIASVDTYRLRTGGTKSCGCINKERIVEYNKIHKKKYTDLPYDKQHKLIYKHWKSMKNRCSRAYKEKGIKICQKWLNFENFYKWSIDNNFKEGLSLDRINNNGNYEPANCRWTDTVTQNRNKGNNHYLTYNGKTHCLSEWEEITNLPVRNRFYKGWSLERVFCTPKKCYNKNKKRSNNAVQSNKNG